MVLVVEGPRGGVHIHIHNHADDPNDLYGGIELHSPVPLYEGQEPIPNCWLLGGNCHCDGSSLYCHERLIPRFQRASESELEKLFEQELHDWYVDRFQKDDHETSNSP